MRKHCSNVCKFRPCLATESTNPAPMRTIVTVALQRQYSQTEIIFWITLVVSKRRQEEASRTGDDASQNQVAIWNCFAIS
jgi:hypothetical protein